MKDKKAVLAQKLWSGIIAALMVYAYMAGYGPGVSKSYAATGYTRIESTNYEGFYWRHQDFKGYLNGNINPIEDSEFKIVPGLADPNYVSFESVNYPGYYLRHNNFKIVLNQNDGTALFAQDASFKRVAGLADSSKISYQSYNYADRYIRHYNFGLQIDPVATGTDLDKKDATFQEVDVASGTPTISVTGNQTALPISPMMYGLMTEDISHSGDGGLYAELIRNRNFKESSMSPVNWTLIQAQGAAGTFALDTADPLNADYPVSGKLTITSATSTKRVGVANGGYWGIPIRPSTTYTASFYAKASAGFTAAKVGLESNDGKTVFASASVSNLSTSWQKFTVNLTTSASAAVSSANRFVISANKTGTLWLNLVSLFPPTYNNRPNGMRIDLMQQLNGLQPSFLRFPGGNFLEGNTVADRFDWKKTIGDLSTRPGHNNPWGYPSTDGLGLLEYLEWCEDLGMTPVLGVYAGYNLDGTHVPIDQLGPYIQDALDEIEYVTGSTSTVWGARRAADGHPAPFSLPYVEIGNEDWFDSSGSYEQRYAAFYDAIKAAYPSIKLIASASVTSRPMDVLDEHYYQSEDWMVGSAHRYDHDSRHGTATKVFIGEYAVTAELGADGTGNLNDAVGEAAFMTGLERNSDLTIMAAYAPLLANANALNWNPNLIGFNALNYVLSPSYYVQKMFAENKGDVVLPASYSGSPTNLKYSVTKNSADGTIYMKIVNPAPTATTANVNISGINSVISAEATVLTSASGTDSNSLTNPNKVVPVTASVTSAPSFSYTFQPNSVTVLKLSTN